MKIWKIAQSKNRGYDTYDSAVVVAASADYATRIHPDGDRWNDEKKKWGNFVRGDWADSPANVSVEEVGTANPGAVVGVVCASFNAG